MHGEGCIPQAAALRMSLWVPARNEWTEWMPAPHDCDMCPSNVREELIDGLSLERGSEWTNEWNLLGDTAKPPQSVTKNSPNDRFVWHPTGSASSLSGAFPGLRGTEAAVSLALSRWCAMPDQEPAPSGPWSGSACWTQVSENVLLRANPVCTCIPGPAKRRLGLRELG